MPDPLKTILQQIADLRIPVKEDESFYDGVDFEQLILAVMNEGHEGVPLIEEVLEPLADRFVIAHKAEIQKAADLGQDLGKALMK